MGPIRLPRGPTWPDWFFDVTSPFDRSHPTELELVAWQPLIDGVNALATVVQALALVVERLTVLVDELRALVSGKVTHTPPADNS